MEVPAGRFASHGASGSSIDFTSDFGATLRQANDGFFGVRKHNICTSEPTPTTRHRHESTWGRLHEHGLFFPL